MMNETQTVEPMLFSVREAAKSLGISERSLWSVTAPRGPLKATRINNRVLYSREHLMEFIELQSQTVGG